LCLRDLRHRFHRSESTDRSQFTGIVQALGSLPWFRDSLGALWGLITSTFAHFELWHVAFNLYWLWRFGAVLERTMGRTRWAALYITLALTSSAAELTVAGETGVGASGVVYGFFGFIWAARRAVPAFAKILDGRTVQLFVVWLWFCIIATIADFFPVANAAHIAGLLAGLLLAHLFVWHRRKMLAAASFAILAASCSLGLYWAPWTSSWTTEQAIKAYEKRDFKQAEDWTRRSLQNGEEKGWCWDMLARIFVASRDRKGYDIALENLQKIDASRAERIEKEMHSFWTPRAEAKSDLDRNREK
jgi:rhomboid protease GluP